MEYWKISDFAKAVGKHQNTVAGWFKDLEGSKIHWINRTEFGEKLYNSLDLRIANFIKEKREEKWALEVIYRELPNRFELRPFSEKTTNTPNVYDQDVFRKEIETVARELAAAQVEEIKEQFNTLIKHLPELKTKDQERQERTTEYLTHWKIESQLKQEALNLWRQKPKEERTIKEGVFRRVEDLNKREIFINAYISEHLEARIKKEYEI